VIRRAPGTPLTFVHIVEAAEANHVALQCVLNEARLNLSELRNDRRGAPYYCEVLDNEHVFLSATDEGSLSCAVCVRTDEKSALAGLGIDIAKVAEFEDEKSLRVMSRRLLVYEECKLLQGLDPSFRPQMLATMFSVREAAVKSIADQVRNYEDGGATLCGMNLTDFMVLANENGQVGVSPRGEAVLRLIGVSTIEAAWDWCEGYVAATAIAL
ncbi:MAG TPA: 4'-phosphopantetheinyl transferase superfamily protein, partial [Candidatus Nitrosotenuis sp.]|nr:4'-phosphopantetheinyl transferase superfamily protein [Candidatus Nitrosotenuis sp.]